jgi:hypothetical protein
MDASTLKAFFTRRMIPAESQKSVETTTRKPLFLFLLSGLFLLRYEQRALSD